MKKLHSLAALFALAASSQAEVLIYKGTEHAHVSSGLPYPTVAGLYLIVDPGQSLSTTIFYYRTGSQRIFFSGPPAEVRSVSAPLPKGRTASLLSLAGASGNDNTNFDHSLSYFRGTDNTLTIKSAGFGSTFNYPKLFGGGSLNIGSINGDGRFIEVKVGLAYQRARTIAANDAGQTIQQVVDALSAELVAKGYQMP
jgi:hypothetical protein